MMRKDENSRISISMIEEEEEEEEDYKPIACYCLANEFHPRLDEPNRSEQQSPGMSIWNSFTLFWLPQTGVTVYSSKPYRYRLSAYETTACL